MEEEPSEEMSAYHKITLLLKVMIIKSKPLFYDIRYAKKILHR